MSYFTLEHPASCSIVFSAGRWCYQMLVETAYKAAWMKRWNCRSRTVTVEKSF